MQTESGDVVISGAVGRLDVFAAAIRATAEREGYFVHVRIAQDVRDYQVVIQIRHDQSETWHTHTAALLTLDASEPRIALFNYLMNLIRLTAP